MKILNDNIEKWKKEHNIVLTLKELQIIHDAIMSIPYKDMPNSTKDFIYNIDEFDGLCNDISKAIIKLDGLYEDWERDWER